MNEDAADALPQRPRGAARLRRRRARRRRAGPLPETTACAVSFVPFRRLSQRASKPTSASCGLEGERLEVSSRVAAGRLDRAERLLDDEAAEHRAAVIELARAVYLEESFDPAAASRRIEALVHRRGQRACTRIEEAAVEGENPREVEQRKPSAPSAAPSARSSSRRSTPSPAGTATSSSSRLGLRPRCAERRPAGRAGGRRRLPPAPDCGAGGRDGSRRLALLRVQRPAEPRARGVVRLRRDLRTFSAVPA